MNIPEARLKLSETIQEFMVDLAIDEDMSISEIAEVEESMAELTEMLLDTLHLEVREVNEDHVVVAAVLPE